MLIACPDCGARYDVPEVRVAPGRTVRCGACGRNWVPRAQAGAVPGAVPGADTPATGPSPVPAPAPARPVGPRPDLSPAELNAPSAAARIAPVAPRPARAAVAADPRPPAMPAASSPPKPAPKPAVGPAPAPARAWEARPAPAVMDRARPEPSLALPASPAGRAAPDRAAQDWAAQDQSWPFPPMMPPRARRSAALPAAWLATVLVLVVAGFGFVRYQSAIESAWPPSARIYGAVGLEP